MACGSGIVTTPSEIRVRVELTILFLSPLGDPNSELNKVRKEVHGVECSDLEARALGYFGFEMVLGLPRRPLKSYG